MIQWKEPPPSGSKPFEAVWLKRLAPCVEKPGEWALVVTRKTPELAKHMANRLRRRRQRIPEPDGEWEFAARGVDVYAVFHG